LISVDDVRPAFQHLVDLGAGQAVLGQEALGAAGGDDVEADLERACAPPAARGLVAVAHRDEDGAADRHRDAGAELALGEGDGEVAVEPHDLAGGAHLGAEHVSTPGKRANGNTASLTPTWSSFFRLSPKGERLARHDARGDLGDGLPIALATKGTVREARGLTSST
jgi:hypothetical protein